MPISNQEDLARAGALIDELRQLIGLVPADALPVDGSAPAPDAAPEPAPSDQFSTPALASKGASVPTIEPVDEAEVPDEVKAADQGGQG